jgi:hypothetical protein
MIVRLDAVVSSALTRFWIIGAPDISPREFTEAMAVQRTLARSALLELKGAGWAAARQYDRGNKGLTIEATTNVIFSSEAEAFDFINSFSRADGSAPHPMAGTIYLRCNDASDSWIEESMASAVLAVIGLEQIGSVSVNVRYRITGGLLTAGTSGDYSWLYDSNGAHITDGEGRFMFDAAHDE